MEAFYTCIKHDHGLRVVRFFLEMRSLDEDLMEFLILLLEFALNQNYCILYLNGSCHIPYAALAETKET